MRFMSIVILCCLATLACCSSLAEDETLNDFLENFEREEMIKELKDEVAKRRKGTVINTETDKIIDMFDKKSV